MLRYHRIKGKHFEWILQSEEWQFLEKNVKYKHIAIYWQPRNRYCKLCVIPVIDNYCISLTIKLLPPLSKGNIPLIHICLFKNHHKFHPPGFEFHTPRIICSSIHLMSMSTPPHNRCLLIVSACYSIYNCIPWRFLQVIPATITSDLSFLYLHRWELPGNYAYFQKNW